MPVIERIAAARREADAARPSDWPAVLVGLVGADIAASLTPAMHEREGAEQHLRLIYRRIDLSELSLGPEALPDILTAAERFGFAGLNITHPCKQAVIPLLDELSPDAKALGAVNTVVMHEGRRIGHNTDWSGFAESFRSELPGAPVERVVQFGAGGAGAAVAHALLTLGAGEVVLVDTDKPRAEQLAAALCARFGAGRATPCAAVKFAMAVADGVVNTTPMGMARYPGMAVPAELIRSEMWVADIVYFPRETALLKEAAARGCRVLPGGGMAVHQAVGAFRLFTGRAPDAARMARHFTQMQTQAGRAA